MRKYRVKEVRSRNGTTFHPQYRKYFIWWHMRVEVVTGKIIVFGSLKQAMICIEEYSRRMDPVDETVIIHGIRIDSDGEAKEYQWKGRS